MVKIINKKSGQELFATTYLGESESVIYCHDLTDVYELSKSEYYVEI